MPYLHILWELETKGGRDLVRIYNTKRVISLTVRLQVKACAFVTELLRQWQNHDKNPIHTNQWKVSKMTHLPTDILLIERFFINSSGEVD